MRKIFIIIVLITLYSCKKETVARNGFTENLNGTWVINDVVATRSGNAIDPAYKEGDKWVIDGGNIKINGKWYTFKDSLVDGSHTPFIGNGKDYQFRPHSVPQDGDIGLIETDGDIVQSIDFGKEMVIRD